ncbi:MAG: septal ring lytic transglycosylase RlpA family protein [Candidatus Accumulibacter sp.]|nr:septal ring lytic transglycosylase RlpA family protein [Accumulibacter sp.]
MQKRGGAYYKDDGPADEIPRDLDSIPDAQPRLEPLHRGANRPYVVLGKSYVPNTTLKPVRERGIASWYGRKFHGQKTSIGERYDMFAMTAAHKTLAIPSYARVTNLDNGKSVVVRVTDRGPFHAGRIIDLSYAAAYRLGYVDAGSARVEVETLLPTDSTSPLHAETRTPAPPPKPVAIQPRHDEFERLVTQLAQETDEGDMAGVAEPPAAVGEAKGVFLQLGAFANADNAESLRIHLTRELDWLTESLHIQAGDGIYRVQLGPYGSRAEAATVAEKIRLALGYPPSFVVR